MLSDLSADEISMSSDEEEEQLRVPRRVFKQRLNPLEHYNEDQFKARYRLSKNIFMELMQSLSHLEPFTQRNHSISAAEQVLLTINYYASGGFQISVADHVRVHKSTACRIIQNVSREVAKLRPKYVQMPRTVQEQAQIRNDFYSIANFPKVIGALDCTHIKIQSPGGPSAELYRNRKGYFSLNVQVVCDSNLKILDIVCRWPGSVHDTTIFNDSHLRADFEMGVYNSHILLGDSGYPCRKYLLTPFLQPSTNSEEAYNRAHIATRNPVERCFGVWKRRFPCLAMGLRVNLDTTMNIIVACAVLHNIALSHNDDIDSIPGIVLPVEPEIENPPVLQSQGSNLNFSVRAALVQTHFSQ